MRRLVLLAVPLVLAACGGSSNGIVPVAHTSLSLSGPWRFAVDRGRMGVREGWSASGFDDRAWAPVRVPHTWNVMPAHLDYSGSPGTAASSTCPAVRATPTCGCASTPSSTPRASG